LEYSYVIKDDLTGANKIIFVHGGIIPSAPLEEQLSVKTIEDYHSFLTKNKLKYDNSFLWIRKDFYNMDSEVWDNKLVIHGHTPVHLMKEWFSKPPHINFSQKRKYLNPGFFEYATFNDSLPFFRLKKILHKAIVVSINIDTGCSNERRLTAIGFDPLNLNDNKIPIIIVQVEIANNKIFEHKSQLSL
jgi:hypothetical protein